MQLPDNKTDSKHNSLLFATNKKQIFINEKEATQKGRSLLLGRHWGRQDLNKKNPIPLDPCWIGGLNSICSLPSDNSLLLDTAR